MIDPEATMLAGGERAAGRILFALALGNLRAQVFWLTGLSGAGKSSIAEATVACLTAAGVETVHLDGDSLRAGLCRDLGFTPEDRMENVRRAAEVAKLMVAQGRPTLCSLISPLRVHRDQARRILGETYVEVYIRCDVEECIRRDPKGLYARALAGELPAFTGIDAPYEAPDRPELILDTQATDLATCVERLVARVAGEGRH